jgi:hypothetical protein
MSYQPARYANPIFEEMERIFGFDEDLRQLASGRRARPRQVEHKHAQAQ